CSSFVTCGLSFFLFCLLFLFIIYSFFLMLLRPPSSTLFPYTTLFRSYEWFFIIVSIFGIVTLVWGSYMAVKQTDLKAILAFSTVSQLGMIMAMLGFGTKVAVFAAVFQIGRASCRESV